LPDTPVESFLGREQHLTSQIQEEFKSSGEVGKKEKRLKRKAELMTDTNR